MPLGKELEKVVKVLAVAMGPDDHGGKGSGERTPSRTWGTLSPAITSHTMLNCKHYAKTIASI